MKGPLKVGIPMQVKQIGIKCGPILFYRINIGVECQDPRVKNVMCKLIAILWLTSGVVFLKYNPRAQVLCNGLYATRVCNNTQGHGFLYVCNDMYGHELLFLLKSSGGALIVKSMDPRGCTQGVSIVPRGCNVYIRYGYHLFQLCKYTRHIIHINLVVFLPQGPQSIIMKWVIYKRSKWIFHPICQPHSSMKFKVEDKRGKTIVWKP